MKVASLSEIAQQYRLDCARQVATLFQEGAEEDGLLNYTEQIEHWRTTKAWIDEVLAKALAEQSHT